MPVVPGAKLNPDLDFGYSGPGSTMSADLETMLTHLREGTGRVEIDLPSAPISGSIEIAAQLARERRAAISRGERTAYLYVAPAFKRSIAMKVTDGESRALMDAGATWIGPEMYAPKPPVTRPTRMIEQFSLHDFKAHRETELRFDRLTMLVGDNASGKTSVLEALALQGGLRPPLDNLRQGRWSIPNLLRRGSTSGRLSLMSSGLRGLQAWKTTIQMYQTDKQKYAVEVSARVDDTTLNASAKGDAQNGFGFDHNWDTIYAVTGSATMCRPRGEQIAAAAYSHDPKARVEADGTNTAVVLAAMKLGDDEKFDLIEEAMRRLVPSLERVRIRPEMVADNPRAVPTKRGSKIYFDFRGAKDVPADGASYGTLVLLSLLTTIYAPASPDMLLIDDLEQGLHPRAQRELVQLLLDLISRQEFSNLQIIATTHSPYVLDLLDPSAVHALALREDGTVASKPLSEHPDAEKMNGSLTAGQLWSLDEERNWVLR
jgi:predicted ATPase